MNDSEYNFLVEEMYENYRHFIKKAITKCIIRQVRRDNIKPHKTYTFSFQRFLIERRHRYSDSTLARINDGKRSTPPTIDKDKYKAMHDMLCMIIRNHKKIFNLEPVCNYGYDNSFCFDFSEDYININVFFTILEDNI
jgi:hypothetical protein